MSNDYPLFCRHHSYHVAVYKSPNPSNSQDRPMHVSSGPPAPCGQCVDPTLLDDSSRILTTTLSLSSEPTADTVSIAVKTRCITACSSLNVVSRHSSLLQCMQEPLFLCAATSPDSPPVPFCGRCLDLTTLLAFSVVESNVSTVR